MILSLFSSSGLLRRGVRPFKPRLKLRVAHSCSAPVCGCPNLSLLRPALSRGAADHRPQRLRYLRYLKVLVPLLVRVHLLRSVVTTWRLRRVAGFAQWKTKGLQIAGASPSYL